MKSKAVPTRVTLALPAYNEERALPALLDRVQEAFTYLDGPGDVILVNDGSIDSTRDVALRHQLALDGKLRVVDHSRNRGLAAAMETAIGRFLERADLEDVLVTMDADDTHDPAEIPLLIDRLDSGADVVIGSRFQPGAQVLGVSPLRRFLSNGVQYFMRLMAPLRGVHDYSCGYRAYRASKLQEAAREYGKRLIQTRAFSVQSELLIKCAAVGARIEEVPIILHYDRKIGQTKIRIARTIAGYFRLVPMYRRVFRVTGGST